MEHELKSLLGPQYVLTGTDRNKWLTDWTGAYTADPIAVVRPADTAQVAAVLKLAQATGTPVVPVSGNTGLTGGTSGRGMLMLSLDRLNQITQIDVPGRTATVGAGVVLSHLHTAVDDHNLIFPLTFGARGTAMIGGVISTNAGGSNVLRYGNTRDLVLGLEVVTAAGEIINLMGRLHKDNAGLDLKHLMIGAEGTLGIITAATLKLFPKPRAYATAMVALPSLSDALTLLNRLQSDSSRAVEAFEYMPRSYIDHYLTHTKGATPPFAESHDINVFIELGATAPRDAIPDATGAIAVQTLLTDTLADMLERGTVLDAAVAQTGAQRAQMWHRREVAGEITFLKHPHVNSDIAVALPDVATCLSRITAGLAALDPQATELVVAHLGDGNIHHTAYPSRDDPALKDAIIEMVEDVVQSLAGSFSAEHGVGTSKLRTMARRKDPAALAAMRAIKTALDPQNILNPGKVFPD